MRSRIAVVLAVAVLFSLLPTSVSLADCPRILHPDEPPCDCDGPVPLGAPVTVTLLTFWDGSELWVNLQTYIECDDTTYTNVVPGSLHAYCPNGPVNPCAARALAP